MAAIYSTGNKKISKVAYIPTGSSVSLPTVGISAKRFVQFWDLMDAIQVHGYMRAAMGVIGRSAVGAGWSLRAHEEFGKEATERQRKRLMRLYLGTERPWTNIKDFQSTPYKLMAGAMYLRYFGQTAYQITRNAAGQAVGFDVLTGFVVPNVDEEGNFKDPAFLQFPTHIPTYSVPFAAKDIIFITNPNWEGYPSGGSDIEAAADFAIPLDLYLQVAAREYMKNRDKPEAFYILPNDISDDAFNDFVKALEERYSGPANVGKSPTVVAGDLEIKELSRLPSDLPYQQARQDTRQELLAVTGVAGSKLGITDSLSSANLRESRREFHETTMIPLFRLLETGFYDQLHVRELGIRGWAFHFNNPDFLTAVERATVHMRYHDMGAITPNEIRNDLGKPARPDPAGDMFADEAKHETPQDNNTQNTPGSPPEGRPVEPDAPSQTGEPTLDDQDPVRGDQHDDVTERALTDELRRWKTFAIRRARQKKTPRPFITTVIPSYLGNAIQGNLDNCRTAEEVSRIFNDVLRMLAEEAVEDGA